MSQHDDLIARLAAFEATPLVQHWPMARELMRDARAAIEDAAPEVAWQPIEKLAGGGRG